MRKAVLQCSVAATALVWVWAASAQTPTRPLFRSGDWLGTRPGKTAPISGEEAQRSIEVNVESAWLADPLTFPQELSARVKDNKLLVQGWVPNGLIRERVLKVARTRFAGTVVDALEENANFEARLEKLPPAEVQRLAITALHRAVPQQSGNLTVHCAANGATVLSGHVSSVDEHRAAGLALRRVPGCTAVINQTRIVPRVDAPVSQAKAPPSAGVQGPANVALPAKDGPGLPPPAGGLSSPLKLATHTGKSPGGNAPAGQHVPPNREPAKPAAVGRLQPSAKPTVPEQPYVTRGVIVVDDPAAATPPPPTTPLPASGLPNLLKQRIQKICGDSARVIQVNFLTPSKLLVEIHFLDGSESEPVARRILAMPELQAYDPIIQAYSR